jgi:hypothetical protein
MQKHAGILFISKTTSRILLILEDSKWTVPTFVRGQSVVEDSKDLIQSYHGKEARLIPIELYLSQDQGFEFSTYICLVDNDFLVNVKDTFCWASIEHLPKNIHSGLKATLTNKITQTKIETILMMGRTA